MKVTAFNADATAAGGTRTVAHGNSATPQVVILWTAGGGFTGSVDAITGTNLARGFGIALSSTSRVAIVNRIPDAQATSVLSRGHRTDCCLYIVSNTPAINGQYDINSIDATNVVFDVDVAWAANARIFMLTIGGADLTGVALVESQEPVATGTQDITSASFGTPSGAVFISADYATAPSNQARGDSTLSLGFYDGTDSYVLASGGDDAAAVMVTNAYGNAGEVIALFATAVVTIDAIAAPVAGWITDGVQINWSQRAATRYFWTLLLKGPQCKVATGTTQTDTTTDINVTTGFTPRGGLILSAVAAEDASDTPHAHDRISIGAFDSATSRATFAYYDENAADPSITSGAQENDAVYANITDATINGLMDVKTVASPMVFIMDDADPAGTFFGGFFLGDTAAAGGGQPTSKRWGGVPFGSPIGRGVW